MDKKTKKHLIKRLTMAKLQKNNERVYAICESCKDNPCILDFKYGSLPDRCPYKISDEKGKYKAKWKELKPCEIVK